MRLRRREEKKIRIMPLGYRRGDPEPYTPSCRAVAVCAAAPSKRIAKTEEGPPLLRITRHEYRAMVQRRTTTRSEKHIILSTGYPHVS